MSHSPVLVIGEDPEGMLTPYDERLRVEPYRRYVEAQTPREHGLYGSLVATGMAETADWPAFVEACGRRYGRQGLFYDAEMDRVYEVSTYNPDSRWDWYELGGRWTGYFGLRAGASGVQGEPGLMTAPAKDGWVDQARKRDIDFDAMRDRHRTAARAEIRQVLAVLKDQPPLMPWARYCDEWPHDVDGARRAYWAQPGLIALHDAHLQSVGCPVEIYCLDSVDPETAYVTRIVRLRTTPFAILTEEGGWLERGRMGWFGAVQDEADETDWSERAWRVIDAAPNDALFSLYDVHI